MTNKLIAFQGEHGAYSEEAAFEFFGNDAVTIPCKSFENVFNEVNEESATHGLIPVENSLAGSIHRNYDLLLRNTLTITSEYHLRVKHCLLGLPSVELDQVKQVYSHPQALAQCENNLKNLGLPGIAEYDTAGSARLLKDNNNQSSAAIASKHAAKVYGLNILKEGFEDNPNNYTRFLAIQRENEKLESKTIENHKTSIVFGLKNSPGILFEALSSFATRKIDLSKIESRPLIGKLWEYYFYIDFIGHQSDPNCLAAIEELSDISNFFRVLGSYPRHQID